MNETINEIISVRKAIAEAMLEFYIKTGVENMQIPVVCRLLQNSYWAHDRSDVIIEKSMQKSDCYGAFLIKTGQQIGFARIVTDDATFFWLCDVIVDEKYRGYGVGKMLMAAIKDNAKYRPVQTNKYSKYKKKRKHRKSSGK